MCSGVLVIIEHILTFKSLEMPLISLTFARIKIFGMITFIPSSFHSSGILIQTASILLMSGLWEANP